MRAALALDDCWVTFLAAQNAKAHHTEELTLHRVNKDNRLVARRGQSFDLVVTVPAALGSESFAQQIVFAIGKRPVPNVGSKPLRKDSWCVRYVAVEPIKGDTLHMNINMQLQLPLSASVGTFSISIAGEGLRARVLGTIMILFNPWHPMDDVYMPSEELLKEYVTLPYSHVFTGDVLDPGLEGIQSHAWNFHQAEVLAIVLGLIVDNLPDSAHRKDPRQVARALTHILEATSDHPTGVLMGRWDGIYDDGTKPSAWMGSRAVYFRFRDSSRSTARYAQCWVFAGVLVSALRAIGIPARPVTVFRSAHDHAPYDFVIDRHKGETVWVSGCFASSSRLVCVCVSGCLCMYVCVCTCVFVFSSSLCLVFLLLLPPSTFVSLVFSVSFSPILFLIFIFYFLKKKVRVLCLTIPYASISLHIGRTSTCGPRLG